MWNMYCALTTVVKNHGDGCVKMDYWGIVRGLKK